jgi:hypothetical protein
VPRYLPDTENMTRRTGPEWPQRVMYSSLVERSKSLTLPSPPPVTSTLPFGLKVTLLTSCELKPRDCKNSNSPLGRASCKAATPLAVTTAMTKPSGWNATDPTPAKWSVKMCSTSAVRQSQTIALPSALAVTR